jgi:hypothetical protein
MAWTMSNKTSLKWREGSDVRLARQRNQQTIVVKVETCRCDKCPKDEK